MFICLIPLRKEEGVPMLIPSNAESEEVDMQKSTATRRARKMCSMTR